MSFRNALRAGTTDYHDVVDGLFGRFDMTDRRQYIAFLSAHARVLPAAEHALEQGGIDRLVPDWADRRRNQMLRADMAALGLPMPPQLSFAALSSEEELWGAAYVLEGSKLGGAMLSKRVPADFPSTYLAYQGPKGAVKAFMDRLDAATAVNRESAVASARCVFSAFRNAAELELEIPVFDR